jgi:hypothetical protein
MYRCEKFYNIGPRQCHLLKGKKNETSYLKFFRNKLERSKAKISSGLMMQPQGMDSTQVDSSLSQEGSEW